MPACAVPKCKNYGRKTKGTDIKYYRFPKANDLAKKWIAACRRGDKINLKHACVCSLHFELSCFEIPLQHRMLNYNTKNCRNIKEDAVPTLNLPTPKHDDLKKEADDDDGRTNRTVKRNHRKDVNEFVGSAINQDETKNNEVVKE